MQIQQRELSVRQRAVSFLLAILMILMGIPSSLTSTLADGSMGGGLSGYNSGRNNVLTNVSVSFYDSKFHAITEADSGELFYLSVQLAGNNVNEPFGKDNFRLEISDNNLLLPNFAGNGFKDGAVYNGFTLHYDEATGKRYLDYDIRNGDTKMIRLQAKFANGITPDGLKETVKLIQTSSGKTISNTITANSNLAWNQNKSQDKNMLSGDAFKNGGSVTVNYTLSASSNNANKSKGAWFASGLHFVDNLKIPEGISAEITEDIVKKAIENAGFTVSDDAKVTVTQSGDTIKIEFWVDSKDESKEMDSVNIILPVTFTCDDPEISITTDNVTITNGLTVSVSGIGEETYKEISKSSVSLSVSKPTVSKASFEITKKADPESLDYDENMTAGTNGKTATVKYTVTVKNTGDKKGDITLKEDPASDITINSINLPENVPDGVTATVDGTSSITIKDVPAKSDEITFTVNATITASGVGSFTNHIYEEGNENNGAYATTNVTKKEAKITSDKFGWVGTNPNDTSDKAYKAGEQINYSIIIKNTGTDNKKVSVIDDLSAVVDGTNFIENGVITWKDTATVTAKKISNGTAVDVSNISTNLINNRYDTEIKVDPDTEITITFSGTVNGTTTGIGDDAVTTIPDSITNNAEVDEKPVSATLTKGKPILGVTKTADNRQIVKNDGEQTVTYEVVISNTGKVTANDLEITEKPEDGITIKSVSIATDKTSLTGVEDLENLNAEIKSNVITIKNGEEEITSLNDGDKITLTVTATINPTEDTYKNEVEVSADNADKATGFETVSATTPPKKMSITKELVKVNNEKVPNDTEISIGDKLTYQIKVINDEEPTDDEDEKKARTIENLY
ncbi:MAG: DUF11 domain-containing protein, partial [Oscillospiraceae bacterium]|nr:DUF11 domain-containing protein [Oscillospiraceae bacterium]